MAAVYASGARRLSAGRLDESLVTTYASKPCEARGRGQQRWECAYARMNMAMDARVGASKAEHEHTHTTRVVNGGCVRDVCGMCAHRLHQQLAQLEGTATL